MRYVCPKNEESEMRYITASLGISAVALFCSAYAVFSFLNPGFRHMDDYVSKLGAEAQPYAHWWNLIGFFSVGIILAGFGSALGRVTQDRLVGVLLTLFGVGFCATALPIDLGDATSSMSKAHTASICLALAAWMLGLARIASLPSLGKAVQSNAKVAATLLVLPILGFVAGFWTMPVTHRLVFTVVFGWIVVTSCRLLWDGCDMTEPDSRGANKSG